MNNSSSNSKIINKDKSVTISEVSNGFIVQVSENIHHVNGKSIEVKQVLISPLIEDALSKVRVFFKDEKGD